MAEVLQEIGELKEERRGLKHERVENPHRVDIIDGRITAIDNRLAALTALQGMFQPPISVYPYSLRWHPLKKILMAI